MSRKSKIDQVNPEQAKKLASKGFTDREIADFFDVALSSLSLYKEKSKLISDAIKDGRKVSDAVVEISMYQAACGYQLPEEKVFMHKGRIVTHRVIKNYPPDTVAAMFWLANRNKERWQHISHIEHGGEDGKPIAFNIHVVQVDGKNS